jgi:hypothetical protein
MAHAVEACVYQLLLETLAYRIVNALLVIVVEVYVLNHKRMEMRVELIPIAI